jgi:hypothetical protein
MNSTCVKGKCPTLPLSSPSHSPLIDIFVTFTMSPTCHTRPFKFSFSFFLYFIQHCFICRPSDSTVSEEAGIETRTVATTALVLSIALTTRLNLIHTRPTKSHPQLGYISSTLGKICMCFFSRRDSGRETKRSMTYKSSKKSCQNY